MQADKDSTDSDGANVKQARRKHQGQTASEVMISAILKRNILATRSSLMSYISNARDIKTPRTLRYSSKHLIRADDLPQKKDKSESRYLTTSREAHLRLHNEIQVFLHNSADQGLGFHGNIVYATYIVFLRQCRGRIWHSEPLWNPC